MSDNSVRTDVNKWCFSSKQPTQQMHRNNCGNEAKDVWFQYLDSAYTDDWSFLSGRSYVYNCFWFVCRPWFNIRKRQRRLDILSRDSASTTQNEIKPNLKQKTSLSANKGSVVVDKTWQKKGMRSSSTRTKKIKIFFDEEHSVISEDKKTTKKEKKKKVCVSHFQVHAKGHYGSLEN